MSEKQDKTVNTAMSERHVLGHLMLTTPGGWSCCQPYITTGKLRQGGARKMEPASSDSALREGLSKWPRNSVRQTQAPWGWFTLFSVVSNAAVFQLLFFGPKGKNKAQPSGASEWGLGEPDPPLPTGDPRLPKTRERPTPPVFFLMLIGPPLKQPWVPASAK